MASSLQRYPDKLRRIHYVDPEADKSLVFLTNNFELPPLVIAGLYKSCWQVELFFKWIKQNLRIKHFFGHSVASTAWDFTNDLLALLGAKLTFGHVGTIGETGHNC